MSNNDLAVYLRNTVWNKFVPLVKKDKCEVCGGTENLQVHHMYSFAQIIDDTLADLNLKRKPVGEYSNLELKNIREKVMGKHLLYKYETLCKNCHLCGVHKHKRIKVEEFIIPNQFLNTILFKQQLIELIKKYNFRDKDYDLITVNKFLNLIKDRYKVSKKRIRVDGKRVTTYTIRKFENYSL